MHSFMHWWRTKLCTWPCFCSSALVSIVLENIYSNKLPLMALVLVKVIFASTIAKYIYFNELYHVLALLLYWFPSQ